MRMPDSLRIYGANIAGQSIGSENYEAARTAFLKHYDASRVNEDKKCFVCQTDGKTWQPGMDEGYHVFLVREDIMSAILQDCEFEFTKRKGMGRAQPKDWIKEQVSAGTELWFTLRFEPSYD